MKKTYIPPVVEIMEMENGEILAGSLNHSGRASYTLGTESINIKTGAISNGTGNGFEQGAKDFEFSFAEDFEYDF